MKYSIGDFVVCKPKFDETTKKFSGVIRGIKTLSNKTIFIVMNLRSAAHYELEENEIELDWD